MLGEQREKRKGVMGPGTAPSTAPASVLQPPVFVVPQLCFALSMLGNPPVTLLDEPSTGMDPKAKQHMW